MPCPFARLAAFASAADVAKAKQYLAQHGHDDHHGNAHASTSASMAPASTLSEYLKHATAKAHRDVESSEGVRRLMGLASGGSTSTRSEEGIFVFSRLDYVRWTIMLGCIYAALESSLVREEHHFGQRTKSSSRAPMLRPLLAARPESSSAFSLLDHLLRFRAISEDVDAHLAILHQSQTNEEGAGLTLEEIVEQCYEVEGVDHVGELEKAMGHIVQEPLLRVPTSITPDDASLSTKSTHGITTAHLRLLTPTQAEATVIYVRRLLALSRSDVPGAPDLLLSHAYVRYLGDLSGGQHIRRRVEKLFPAGDEASTLRRDTGFAFYEFPPPTHSDKPAGEWHRHLKDVFRQAMDGSVDDLPACQRQDAMHSQGLESSLAFELNKDLFEGLIGQTPEESRRAMDAMDRVVVAAKRSIASRPVLGASIGSDDSFASSSSGWSASSSEDGHDRDDDGTKKTATSTQGHAPTLPSGLLFKLATLGSSKASNTSPASLPLFALVAALAVAVAVGVGALLVAPEVIQRSAESVV